VRTAASSHPHAAVQHDDAFSVSREELCDRAQMLATLGEDERVSR
jgi:hypothetical protein